MAAIEQRFEAAEDIRLLYVAVTRAREELVVALWPDKPDQSSWRPLHDWLQTRATKLDLEVSAPPPRAEVRLGAAADVERRVAESARALEEMRVPTFLHHTVTGLVKPEAAFVSSGEAPSSGRSDELRGFDWGSAVHGALAAAAQSPGLEALRAACRDLLVEHGRPLDDRGEPAELEELTTLVRAVQGSELWGRALRAERVLAEVPFAVPHWNGAPDAEMAGPKPGAPSKPQLDLFGGAKVPEDDGTPAQALAERPPALLEGVIDLAFLEHGGWVIVDYKTDVGTDPEFVARSAAYRRQVDLYAEAWSILTGEPVKERVLFFTAQGRELRW